MRRARMTSLCSCTRASHCALIWSRLGRGPDRELRLFGHPGQPWCSYLVEARPVNSDNWIPIGESTGVTQSFAFVPAGIQSASAIRITDRSGLIWGDHGEALTAPGTRLAGIGAKSVVKDEFFGGD